MRIAVTSQNFRTITGHAGKTRRFLIYQVQAGSEPVEVDRLDLPRELSFHEFAGGPHPVDGTDALLTSTAGDGFMRKMAARGIRVVLTGETDPLQAVKDLLQGRVVPPVPHEHHHHPQHSAGRLLECVAATSPIVRKTANVCLQRSTRPTHRRGHRQFNRSPGG